MDRVTFQWSESLSAGVRQPTSASITNNGRVEHLTIKIKWTDLRIAIPQILGYSYLSANGITAGTFSRKTPAKHPLYPWMRATGVTVNSEVTNGTTYPIAYTSPPDATTVTHANDLTSNVNVGARGTLGKWKYAYLTIQFEILPYLVAEDNSITYEYQRYVSKTMEISVEAMNRRGEIYEFIWPAARSVTPTFAGDIIVKIPKILHRWIWHDVPAAFILEGGLKAKKFEDCVGKVNSTGFPSIVIGIGEINVVTGRAVYFAPGTLLMLPPKFIPKMQHTPYGTMVSSANTDLLGAGGIDPYKYGYPLNYDVEINFVEFNPTLTNDQTRFTDDYGNTDLIRGHNLVPLPTLTPAGYRWFSAYRGTNPPAPPATIPDNYLIYKYYPFENVFTNVLS